MVAPVSTRARSAACRVPVVDVHRRLNGPHGPRARRTSRWDRVSAHDRLVRDSWLEMADELHPELELVGEEVRRTVVGHTRADHVGGGQLALVDRVVPVLDAPMPSGSRVPHTGDVARDVDARTRCAGTGPRPRRLIPPARQPKPDPCSALPRCLRRPGRRPPGRRSPARPAHRRRLPARARRAIARECRPRGRGAAPRIAPRPRGPATGRSGSSPRSSTVTSQPAVLAAAATSIEIQPPPIMTIEAPGTRRSRMRTLSSIVRR